MTPAPAAVVDDVAPAPRAIGTLPPVLAARPVDLKFLKWLLWVYLALWIIEGALRKWIFPGLATPLLVVRDPVLLLIYSLALAKGIFPASAFIVWIAGISLVALAFSVIGSNAAADRADLRVAGGFPAPAAGLPDPEYLRPRRPAPSGPVDARRRAADGVARAAAIRRRRRFLAQRGRGRRGHDARRRLRPHPALGHVFVHQRAGKFHGHRGGFLRLRSAARRKCFRA